MTFTGSVSDESFARLFEESSCTVVPSLREGYGLVVAESVSAGTPVVVADNPENLATTLIEEGVNGFVVGPSAQAMARGIIAAVVGGDSLRASTIEWNARKRDQMSMHRSADVMVERLPTSDVPERIRPISPADRRKPLSLS